MKGHQQYILIFLFLVVSCTGHHTKRLLADIESYIQIKPDSALTVLSSISPDELRCASLKAKHALLYSMALDKNYIDIAEDSTIRVAVNYYSHKKDRFRAMLAWYYLGRIQMNAGNAGNAVVSLTKADRLADLPHWKGLIYRNLGDLYSQSLDIDMALDCFNRSMESFQEVRETNYAVYSAFDYAQSLYLLNRTDDADSIWTRLREYAKSNDRYLLSQILLAEASMELSRPNSNPDSVIQRIRSGYRISGESYRNKDLANLSLAYALKGKRDSSDLFYSLALSTTVNARDSAKLYAIRYRIENHCGNYFLANEYLEDAMSIQNTLMNKRDNMVIANSLNQYALEEESATRAQAKHRLKLFVSILLLMTLVIVQLIWMVRNHRLKIKEQENQIRREMERTDEILEQLAQTKDENNDILRQIRTAILDQVLMIKQWSDAYYGMIEPIKENKKDPGRIFDDDYISDSEKKEMIMKRFCDSLKVLRSNDSLFHHLEESINLWKDDLMVRVRTVCSCSGNRKHPMDESDFRTMTLMFAGIPDKTIAYLLDLNYGTVRMRRSRYKEFFGIMNSTESSLILKELSPSS